METPVKLIRELPIEQLLGASAAELVEKAMDTVSTVQRDLLALAESEDSEQFTLLKIGTVFQIFLVDVLASGKRANELTADDWQAIADKVEKHAVLEGGKSYSEFVFGLYADYIELSEKVLKVRGVSEDRAAAVKEIADQIRNNTELLQQGEITEVRYVEDNLWLSLDAMIKCLSLYVTPLIGPKYTQLLQSVTQLGFEYGRYMLYAKEQAILQEYLDNQRILDERLQTEYEAYLDEVNKNAERFQGLIAAAFDPGLRESLAQSIALAKAYGVKEADLLKSEEEIDAFFM